MDKVLIKYIKTEPNFNCLNEPQKRYIEELLKCKDIDSFTKKLRDTGDSTPLIYRGYYASFDLINWQRVCRSAVDNELSKKFTGVVEKNPYGVDTNKRNRSSSRKPRSLSRTKYSKKKSISRSSRSSVMSKNSRSLSTNSRSSASGDSLSGSQDTDDSENSEEEKVDPEEQKRNEAKKKMDERMRKSRLLAVIEQAKKRGILPTRNINMESTYQEIWEEAQISKAIIMDEASLELMGKGMTVGSQMLEGISAKTGIMKDELSGLHTTIEKALPKYDPLFLHLLTEYKTEDSSLNNPLFIFFAKLFEDVTGHISRNIVGKEMGIKSGSYSDEEIKRKLAARQN